MESNISNFSQTFSEYTEKVLNDKTLSNLKDFPDLQELISNLNSSLEKHYNNLNSMKNSKKNNYIKHLQLGFSTVITNAVEIENN